MSIKMWENMTINVWEIMTTADTSIEERIMTVIGMVDVIIGLMAMPHRQSSMHRLHCQVSGFSSHPSLSLFLVAKRMSAFDRAPGVQTHPPASITRSAGGRVRLHDLFDYIHNKRELDYGQIFILMLLKIKRVRSDNDTAYKRFTLGFLRKRGMRVRN
jgi:hypothetical protein